MRASDIADSILTTLVNLGLSMSDLRGQSYDGTSTMRGAKAGVQAQIRERQPMALYTHCAGHSLNLAILIPCISNCIDQIKSLTLFVKHSPKREGLLKAIVIVRLHLRTVLGKARALLTTVPGNRASPCLHYTRRFGV